MFLLSVLSGVSLATGPWDDLPNGGLPFRTFFVTWTKNGTPEMFDYLKRAKPEVVQVGFYGPMFHGYAHHPKSTGYPMQLPVHGERATLARQREINRQIHQLLPDAKVIGHFQMCNVVGNTDEPFAFIKWYNELWDEKLLGPKPVDDVRELLQRDADGNAIKGGGYIDFIGLCISSPHTQAMLKKMVDVAIDSGVDGLVSNYNYRWGCVCQYCQKAFKSHLSEKYNAAALKDKFGIKDLKTHHFKAIPAKIPGYPKLDDADKRVNALQLEAMHWGAKHFKQVFDDVYIKHGRSRKPNFIVGSWNHLGLVRHTEERAFTPIEMWDRGEDYFWYSGSHAGKKLSDGIAGDAWLNLLWLREMARGKPMMMGKYESVRVRVALAEAAALGGAGTGLYHPFADPVGADVMSRYLNFIHDHPAIYGNVTPVAEVGLLMPRRNVLAGKPKAMDVFRRAGMALSKKQILFDVVLDQRLADKRLAKHAVLLIPEGASLSKQQSSIVKRFADGAGKQVIPIDEQGVEKLTDKLNNPRLSRINGPWTLRTSLYESERSRFLHLVNYNRDEVGAKGMRGPAAELPIAERNIEVTINTQHRIKTVVLHSPDFENPKDASPLEFKQDAKGFVRLTVPVVEVYGVVEFRW